MATDRLAALRAQQGGSYASNQSYNSGGGGGYGAGGGGAGYQSRRPNPYAQRDDDDSNRYEMSNYSNNNNGYAPSNNYEAPSGPARLAKRGPMDMSEFYAEVSSIQDVLRQYNDNVAQISSLHARSLNNIDDQSASRQLNDVIAANRKLSNDLKKRIKALQAQGGDSRDGKTRRQQAALLKEQFQAAIQGYQQVEQKQRNATKNQMERQFKIVKPDATAEEVRAVVNDDSGGPIFQQALMNSDKLGRARQAYREVQERHQDIRKIEETIAELAQLFNDMAILVEEQGETINVIEQTTQAVEKDTEQGLQHTEKAKESAISARKKRWICFFIVVIILIIVAIVIAVQVVQGNIGRRAVNGNNDNTATATVTATATPTAAASTTGGAR